MRNILPLLLLVVCGGLGLEDAAGQGRRGGGNRGPGQKEGSKAAPFELKTKDLKHSLKLADLQGKSGVVLIFGSYT